ncbi:hypothetical protein AAMO2058_001657100 [Amorphochlora amoebiformis]
MGSTCICITLDEACVQAPHVKPTPRDAPQPTVESVTSPCQFFAGTQSLSSAKMSIGSISALDSSRCGRVAQAYQSRVSEMGSGGHGNSLRRKFADMLRPTSKSTVSKYPASERAPDLFLFHRVHKSSRSSRSSHILKPLTPATVPERARSNARIPRSLSDPTISKPFFLVTPRDTLTLSQAPGSRSEVRPSDVEEEFEG